MPAQPFCVPQSALPLVSHACMFLLAFHGVFLAPFSYVFFVLRTMTDLLVRGTQSVAIIFLLHMRLAHMGKGFVFFLFIYYITALLMSTPAGWTL